MKIHLLLSLIFINSIILNAQSVFEYNVDNDFVFKVYNESEGKFYKISEESDFKQDTPENVAISSFFAYSNNLCLLYTSPSPRDRQKSRMPSSA